MKTKLQQLQVENDLLRIVAGSFRFYTLILSIFILFLIALFVITSSIKSADDSDKITLPKTSAGVFFSTNENIAVAVFDLNDKDQASVASQLQAFFIQLSKVKGEDPQ